MPSPDLPIELWIEILTYLPRTALHKMIGVNRPLFELALNDLYEEVRFISDDREMLKTFKQLKHLNIAQRVRHLLIRPAFLPGIDEDVESNLERKLASGYNYLRNLAKSPSSVVSKDSLHDPAFGILEAAKKAVRSCPNLREITIVLHDHALTPLFMSFLDSVWASDLLEAQLRKLTIDTTVVKLPQLLNPIIKRSCALLNLVEFDLNISISRVDESRVEWHLAKDVIHSLITEFRNKLTSFSFSSLVLCNLAVLFEAFPRISNLKKLEFHGIFNIKTFPDTDGFTEFISKHASHLNHLVIKPQTRHLSLNSSDNMYSFWVNEDDVEHQSKGKHSFSHIVLPRLKVLNVGLRDRQMLWPQWQTATYESRNQSLLPNLSRVTPRLKTLIITDISLSYIRICALVKSLQQEGGCGLEELNFICDSIFPQLFDLLSKNLPRLKALTVRFVYTASRPHTNDLDGFDIGSAEVFRELMRARRYSGWGLRYLRLVNLAPCHAEHPNFMVMKDVAESLSPKVVLDTASTCHCSGI